MKLTFYRFDYLRLMMAFAFVLMMISNVKSTTITVSVSSNVFTPSNINANVGDTVKWQWVSGFHTTTCDGIFPGTVLPAGATPWDASISNSTPTFSYKITVAGTYNYVCQPHAPGMAGVITASSGSGGALFQENFSYPAGDSIGSYGWIWNTGSTNTIFVVSPGLTYPGYSLSGIGNACHLRNNGNDAYKSFPGDSVGVLYYSFMARFDSIKTGDYFTALISPTSATNYVARFYAKDSLGGLAFGLSKTTAASGGITYTAGNYSLGTTYVVVIKYQFNPGTNDDVMNAFIFSSGIPSTEPAAPTIGPVTGTANDAPIGRVALRQGQAVSAPTLNIDGIQVAKLWSNITTTISNNNTSIADNFILEQNYPNPFNPSTTIKFNIPENGFVNLSLYNTLGQEVGTLVNGNLSEGLHTFDFNGNGLKSGMYFYKLTFLAKDGKSLVDTKKLILLK